MRTLYENYNTNEKDLYEIYVEDCELNERPIADVNSNDFWDWLVEQQEMEWNDFLDNIESDCDNDVNCVVTGSLGLWNGSRDIEPKAFPSLKSAIYACVSNMDYVIVTEDDGVIKVEAIHHDGRNYFEIHKLNSKGLEAYFNDEEFAKEEYYEKFDIKF